MIAKMNRSRSRVWKRPFCLSPGVRIGAVYLRAGYSPDDYPSEAHWGAREKLERCAAAKCPSVAFQLAGAKKVVCYGPLIDIDDHVGQLMINVAMR